MGGNAFSLGSDARLLRLAGDVSAAADCLDKGRELDKQDRYINNQTTKYMPKKTQPGYF